MLGTVEWDAESERLSDDELTTLALAADPDTEVHEQARPLGDVLGLDAGGLLPGWYMPMSITGAGPLRGWRRRVALLIIVSFAAITAYGLCATYGHVGLL